MPGLANNPIHNDRDAPLHCSIDSAITPNVTEETNNPADDKPQSENVSHAPVAARVPEKVARGIFCTGQVILDSPKEFVIDFLQGLTRPYQVVSRVVLTPQTVAELSDALGKNIEAYTKNFGAPAPVPGPPPKNRPTLAGNLRKLPPARRTAQRHLRQLGNDRPLPHRILHGFHQRVLSNVRSGRENLHARPADPTFPNRVNFQPRKSPPAIPKAG